MHVSALKQSNFLTRADVGQGILVTIRAIHQENIAKTGAPEELKWVIEFEETEKPMVLNSTNGQLIAQITKSDETDDWAGHKVVLYDDPSVSYGGKLVGGIRVRAPRISKAAAAQVKPARPHPHQNPAPGPAQSQPARRPAPAPVPPPEAEYAEPDPALADPDEPPF